MCSGVEFLLRSWVQDSHGECVAHHKKSVLGGGGVVPLLSILNSLILLSPF